MQSVSKKKSIHNPEIHGIFDSFYFVHNPKIHDVFDSFFGYLFLKSVKHFGQNISKSI